MSWVRVYNSSSVVTASSASCTHPAPKRKCHTERDDESDVDNKMLLSAVVVNVCTSYEHVFEDASTTPTGRQRRCSTVPSKLSCVMCMSILLQPICCCKLRNRRSELYLNSKPGVLSSTCSHCISTHDEYWQPFVSVTTNLELRRCPYLLKKRTCGQHFLLFHDQSQW